MQIQTWLRILLLGFGTVTATYWFSRSYREQELKTLQKTLEASQKDLAAATLELKEVDSKLSGLAITHARLGSEYMMLTNRLSNCRFNFSNSWCFWRNDNHEAQIDKLPDTQPVASKQH